MELVQPWFRALGSGFNAHDEPFENEMKAMRATGVLWVSWDHRGIQQDDGLPVFPAEPFHLLSLTLAAAENNKEWGEKMEDLWPMDWVEVLGDQPLRMGIKLHIDSQFTLSRSCGQFFANDSGLLASDDYKRVRRQLVLMAVKAGRHIHDISVPVKLNLRAPVRGEPDTEFDASLLEILQIASLQAAEDRGSVCGITGGRYPDSLLRLSEVEFQIGRKSWSKRTILRVGQLLALGVRVHPIDLRGVKVNNETAQYVIPSLQRFCGVSDPSHGSDTVVIETGEDARYLDAVFSALLVSTSVRELQIKIRRSSIKNRATRRRLWRWIALVFFSGYASNSIEKLTLDVSSLKDADVAVIDELLRARDPLGSLFSTKSTRRVATASKFRLQQSSATSLQASSPKDVDPESQTIVFDRPLRDLPVLDRKRSDSDEVCVLLPGWGRAWIAASDAVITECRTHHDPSIRTDRQLILQGIEERDVTPALSLLRLLASNISSLCLRQCDFSESTLRGIMESCPSLEELRLDDMTLSSLRVITSLYEDDICHAERLHLVLSDLVEEDDSRGFFDTLADSFHPMTRSLRLLEFEHESEELFPRFGHSVLKMLERNRSLCELYLTALHGNDRGEEGQEEKAIVQGDCNSLHSPVVIHLGVPEKLAFLSVVQQQGGAAREPIDRHALHFLDCNVLAEIFRFAGEARTRYVRAALHLYDA